MILLDVVFFATEDARWFDVLDPFLMGANYQLATYDMKISETPTRPSKPHTLPLRGSFKDRDGDPGRLREACHRALPVGRGIPVIFCSFTRDDAGVTILQGDKNANGAFDWLSYVMISDKFRNPQREVLVHELIHAAGYSGDEDKVGDVFLHDKDKSSVMSRVPLEGKRPTVTMEERHAIALRKAYFARNA